ncbi:MAG: NPCBM/NEW2 domain-containing protein, partial [Planctomycetota bacterium]
MLLLLAVLALTTSAPGSPAQDSSSSLRFEVERPDGSLEDLDPNGLAKLVDPRSGGFRPLLLRVVGAPQAAFDPDERVELELLGGDRLGGRVGGGSGEQLYLELPGAAVLSLPIDGFTSLVFDARMPEDPGVPVEPAEIGDRLYRRVANRLDRVDGTIESFSAEGVRFDGLIGSQLYRWEELAALFIEPLVDPEPLVREPGAIAIDLVDGSRLRGRVDALNETELRFEVLPSGEALRLPWRVVRMLASADGRLDWLGELPLTEALDAAPFGDDLGMVWPHRIDRNVDGGTLRVGERRYARGIGVHAPSRLTWILEQGGTLRGAVAIDASTERLAARGSAVFRIEVD